MYSANDIQVFFFAHNRADFLREALDCYLNQTVKGVQLILLANAPTPEVLEVAKDYALKGVDLILEERPLGVYGSVARCQQIATAPITIMAHDDDLVHPAFVENVLHAYNTIPDLAVALSSMGEFSETPDYQGLSPVYCLNAAEFSAYVYAGKPFCFSSCTYKTEFLKQAPAPKFNTFGKISDVPFMINATGKHQAAIFDFHLVRYRTHMAQDSQTFSTGPTAAQWLNLEKFHKDMIFSAGKRNLRLVFYLSHYFRLNMGWRDWCLCEHGKMTFADYLALAAEKGVFCPAAYRLGALVHGGVRRALAGLCLHKKPQPLT